MRGLAERYCVQTSSTSSLICMAALLGAMAMATDIYVDADSGRDGNAGTAPDRAWQTLERVNAADLAPGDTVHFARGCSWRGSLRPRSGAPGNPVTYRAFGAGAKPAFLGSSDRSRPDDWVPVGPDLWATRSAVYRPTAAPVDLSRSAWSRHQEQGADTTFDVVDLPDGEGRGVRMTCRANGSKDNHIQLWGVLPDWDVLGPADVLEFRFRIRADVPFKTGSWSVRRGSSPWTVHGNGSAVEATTEWTTCAVRMPLTARGVEPRLHVNLGGRLPVGGTLDIEPLALVPVALVGPEPLPVDVGNVILDHGEVCGWKKWKVEDLTRALDYVYDPVAARVVMMCPENPGTRYDSIELALKRHVVDQSGAHDVVYDGLAVRYGAAHGFGGGGTRRLTIRNCDISFIGGAHQHSRGNHHVRYGNGIEFWGAARDHLVADCRLWEIYDAALTNQGRSPDSHQINITYRNNIIWNSEYSFEYWNHPAEARTHNIRFVNNTCVDAGYGWAHAQRPDPNGSHLMLYSNTARTSEVVIEHNVFYRSTDWGSRFTGGWDPLPVIDRNLWYEPDGHMCWFFKEKLPAEDVAGYRRKTGFDVHSVFADPKFVDSDAGDFRLRPDTPAGAVRPNGGIVGAASLWPVGR